MISIGSVVGGNKSEVFREHLSQFAQSFEDFPDKIINGYGVSITFHLPGALIKPSFQGRKLGAHLKGKRILVIRVAVPESVSYSLDDSKIRQYLCDASLDAIDFACSILQKRGIDYSPDSDKQEVENWLKVASKDNA